MSYSLRLPTGQIVPIPSGPIVIRRMPRDPELPMTLRMEKPRAARCEKESIYLDDYFVSRTHAVLTTTTEGGHAIEDLSSTCGTFVNDDLILGVVALKAGDKIRVGQTEMRYIDESAPAEDSTEMLWLHLGSD